MVVVSVPKEVVLGDSVSFEMGYSIVLCPCLYRVVYTPKSPVGNERFHTWNQCKLDSAHCDFHGKRFKFHSLGNRLKVVWICPKLVSESSTLVTVVGLQKVDSF